MTRDRFETLAEAFGGEIARWPDAERDAAALLAVAEPEFARGVLARAAGLDAALDAWDAPRAHPALVEAVVASAPPPRRRARLLAWTWRAGLGAGLAAACAAGVLVGVRLTPDPNAGEAAVASAMASFDAVAQEDV